MEGVKISIEDISKYGSPNLITDQKYWNVLMEMEVRVGKEVNGKKESPEYNN